MIPSGLISTSSKGMGAISTAATSGLKGVVDRPWNEDDQSMPLPPKAGSEVAPAFCSGMAPCPGGCEYGAEKTGLIWFSAKAEVVGLAAAEDGEAAGDDGEAAGFCDEDGEEEVFELVYVVAERLYVDCGAAGRELAGLDVGVYVAAVRLDNLSAAGCACVFATSTVAARPLACKEPR